MKLVTMRTCLDMSWHVLTPVLTHPEFVCHLHCALQPKVHMVGVAVMHPLFQAAHSDEVSRLSS